MRLFKLGETEVKCSPLLLAVIPAAFVLGAGRLLIIVAISLSVHEAAHAMAAKRLGLGVDSIEIQPFGFVARLDTRFASPADAASVFAAGPAASLILAAISSLIESIVPAYAAASLGMTEYSLLIALVNLIPAMPLDGGRLVYAAASKKNKPRAFVWLKALGVFFGAVFLGIFGLLVSKGAVNLTFPVMGVFLIAAALRERPETYLPHKTKRMLKSNGSLEVREIAVREELPIANALGLIPRGSYGVIGVLDKDMSLKARVPESELVRAAGLLGAAASVKDAVALRDEKVL